ncbi:MAG TPA: hypothetical protein VGQ16_13490 [Vicinamibacterales bacterium]|jgi:hypothetical protein|nr:hypothetical protein [Vicinamibacterales bacterium]
MTNPDLNATVSDNVKLADEVVGSPSRPLHGFVAILDALGAKNYGAREAEQFLKSRDEFIPFISKIAEEQIKIEPNDFQRFIFNDTVILTYVRGRTFQDAWAFCHVLRVFQSIFLQKQIFFRGAFGVGDFYRLDPASNTVMGPAVSDAATWYERADWIGIHATPYTTIFLKSLLQRENRTLDYVLIDYDVPLKDRGRMRLKAINWPKGVYLNHGKDRNRAKAAVLSFLAKGPLPIGSESKYFNAIEFYDYVEGTQSFGRTAEPVESETHRPR